jgi:predicted DsbA family dithiol-disulfide isomerase
MTQRLKAVGEAEGISFNFGTEWLAVNTLPLHQLLHVAGQEGFKDLLKERFLKAYFDENLHLNTIEVLCSLMAEFGWDIEKTKQVIANDTIAYAVKQEIAHYQQKGVNSVPFFIINGKYGISGAQPSSVFLEAFEQLSSMETVDQGDNCDPTTGTC